MIEGARSALPTAWKTLVVDLDQPLVDVDMAGVRRVHVTAVLGGQPLCAFLLAWPLTRLPARVLADEVLARLPTALAAHRWPRPSPVASAAESGRLTATVLVCTRDRPLDLERCLASLVLTGTVAAEVLVVDNGSRGTRTREVAQAAGARYLSEPLPGLDRARNTGFAAAAGDVVLCTDDDVVVAPGWAEHLLSCFDDPLVMAATGLVLPAVLDTPARQAFEVHAGFGRGVRRRTWDGTAVPATTAGDLGAGASMAFRTSFLRGVGGFPEELDAGMPTRSGGDTYALYQVLRHGYRAVYEPRAMAFHHHRDDERALREAVAGYGTGTFSYLAHAGVRDRDPHAVYSAVRWAGQRLVREPVRTLLRRSDAVPLSLLGAEARGSARSVTAYPAARRQVRARAGVDVAAEPRVTPGPSPAAPEPHAGPRPVTVVRARPPMTIVVPSRGRRQLLTRLLTNLDQQHYDAGACDVVVVLDGDLDGSATAVAGLSLRRPHQVVTLRSPDPRRGLGAAAARNAGADVARGAAGIGAGHLLLFLDDDVDPVGRDLLVDHGTTHQRSTERLALVGACPPRPVLGTAPAARPGRHQQAVRNWWSDHARHLVGVEPLGFADVLTGNLSCTLADLDAVGGFAPLARREDWELGHRLLAAGVSLRPAPGPGVLHDADLDLLSALQDRRAEGAGDAAFARLHTGVAAVLPLVDWLDLRLREQLALGALFRTSTGRDDRAMAGAVRLLTALEAAGSHRAWSVAHGQAMRLAYWRGVAQELASEGELMQLLLGAEEEVWGEVDLADLAGTSPLRPPLRGGSVVVTLDGQPLGRAPLSWGGCPWRSGRFRARVLDRFCGAADRSLAVGALA